MSKTSNFFKTTAILSTALLSLLGACAIEDPIDYTTDGYTSGPQGGGSDDGGNTGSSNDFVEWTRQLGTSSRDEAWDMTSDSSGNVYVTGFTEGALEGSNAGSTDLFVVKYDSGGNKQWTQQLGTSSDDFAYSIAADSSGNVYVTGKTHGALDNNTSAGGEDLFVVKFNSAGVKQWIQQLGTSSNDNAEGITIDSSGNIYVTGATSGAFDNNTNAGGWDLFVVKYNSSGVKQWTQQLGTSENDLAHGIATDSSGNIYLTGHTENGSFDGFSNVGGFDLFVVKYDSAGDWKWTRQVGTASEDVGDSIIADSNGDIYVAGSVGDSLDGNVHYGSTDLILMKYDSDGNKVWTKQLGSSSFDHAYGLTMDDNGNIYITGYTGGNIDGNTEFCNGAMALPGSEDWLACVDTFVVKYDSAGDWKWTKQIGGTSSYDSGEGITTDSSGNVYLTGVTSGNLDGNTNAGEYDLFVMKLK